MSTVQTINDEKKTETCLVCSKRISPGEKIATIYQRHMEATFCCSLCLWTYENDPEPYLKRLELRRKRLHRVRGF